MSRNSFEALYNLVKNRIRRQTTNRREAIDPRERLAVCLRYLATGDSFQTIAISFRMGISTVTGIVGQVCEQIWNVLQPVAMPAPTRHTWETTAADFYNLWGFPNCVGSIDGKHVKVICPSNTGSAYYCHKGFFSVVLLAIVDAKYKFLVADIGAYGRHSDSSILRDSAFHKKYITKQALPPPKPLPGRNATTPHVLVGDEGFALAPYLMRPYPRSAIATDDRKKHFNISLSRSRRVVENAFGLLAMKWRVFGRAINCKITTAEHIIKAACCLHNFIIDEHNPGQSSERNRFEPSDTSNTFIPLSPNNRRCTDDTMQIREDFADFFSNNV
ncbi:uncharacterized protein LOC128270952 [Anopheles cruzii]|uniref:uncharacterized protein LOC128270952 n=1 Tax=Anopheles cruzii TaxID=68878 RepID=UPI0022EC1BCA|nr:uncharacterized protein LOC128270952 [Anopheles cruzii]